MNPESMPQNLQEKHEAEPVFISSVDHTTEIENFLTPEHEALLGEEILAEAKNRSLETEKKLADIFSAQNESSQNSAQTVTYDKYKKTFLIAGEKISTGELVASRHFVGNIENSDIGFMLGKGSETTFEGKRLIKTYKEYTARDTLTSELNRELALALADKTVREDMFKSKAYRAIGERSGVGTKNKTDETNGTNTREGQIGRAHV